MYERLAADASTIDSECRDLARAIAARHSRTPRNRPAQLRCTAALRSRVSPQPTLQLSRPRPSPTGRLLKLTEKERQKEAKEAEALRKLRHPIADELLVDEPLPVPTLEPWPCPRHSLNLIPEHQPLAGSLLALFDYVATCAPFANLCHRLPSIATAPD